MMKRGKKGNVLTKVAEIIGIIAGVIAIIVGIKELPKLISRGEKIIIEKTDLVASSTPIFDLKENDTLRVKDSFSISWSGVSTCGEKDRIEKESQRAFNRWKSEIIKTLDTLRVINSDFVMGEVTTSKSKTWDNARSCNSSGIINCWSEFVRLNN